MTRVAPPSPSRGQHQGPRRGGRWSWVPANTVTRIVVISVLIGAAVAAVYFPLASQHDQSASQPEPSAVGAKRPVSAATGN